MPRKMLINALEPEESRIAVVEENALEEFYLERASRETLVGNVYKGRVVNVLPSLRAAFVDIGLKGKNGFLHASDVVGSLETNGAGGVIEEEAIENAADRKGREEPPIQKLLAVGQEVLVQVSRDGMGEKGPSLSMDISLPGRYLVITPRVRRIAVSKRITEPQERDSLRKLLEELDPPRGVGFIIRTAGADKATRDLKRDLDYLLRLWKAVVVRAQNTRAPAPVFQESDLVIRTIRDIFTNDIDEIVIDSFPVYNRTLEFFQAAMPRYQDHVKFYREPEPLFYKYNVESQIDLIYQRTVPLPSGGSIVIDQTEALTAIDVNSGRFTRTNSPEEMAFRINMEAAQEVVRQLRLRDLGGQIIVDFIDLREEKNRLAVERVLRDAAKKDRSQSTILRMSRLGLVEMARQKVRPGVKLMSYEMCYHCQGTGFTKNVESMSLQVLRQLRQMLGQKDAAFVEIKVHPEVAHYLQNVKRRDLVALEDRNHKTVLIRGVPAFRIADVEISCQDDARQPMKADAAVSAPGAPGAVANEVRRRESELRRSVLAAAQESRVSAPGGDAKDEPLPLEPRTADPTRRAPEPLGPRRAVAAPVTPISVLRPTPEEAEAAAAEKPVAVPVKRIAPAASSPGPSAPAAATPAAPPRRSYGQLMHPVSRSGKALVKPGALPKRPPIRAAIRPPTASAGEEPTALEAAPPPTEPLAPAPLPTPAAADSSAPAAPAVAAKKSTAHGRTRRGKQEAAAPEGEEKPAARRKPAVSAARKRKVGGAKSAEESGSGG